MIDPNDIIITAYPEPQRTGMCIPITRLGVKIVHIPTGIEIIMDVERSQYKNRELALAELERRLEQI